MIKKDVLEQICSKDCLNKKHLSSSSNWMLHLTLCTNCKHSRQLDHYISRKEWEDTEKQFESTSICQKIVNKIIKFFEKGSLRKDQDNYV